MMNRSDGFGFFEITCAPHCVLEAGRDGLLLVLGGSAVCTSGEEDILVPCSRALCMSADERARHITASSDAELMLVSVSGGSLSLPQGIVEGLEPLSDAAKAARLLRRKYFSCDGERQKKCAALVEALICCLEEAGGKYIDEIERLVDEKIGESLKVSDIAEALGLHPDYCSRLFSSARKKSLTSYINEVKIARAKDLLSDEALSVGDVSHLLGFGSPFYFSRVFSGIVGCSPEKYRSAK